MPTLDLRDFPPVGENVERPVSLRQTLLGQFDRCPRSGYLSLRYGGGVGTHPQARGTAFHEMAERAAKEMIAGDDPFYPPELARDLIDEILVSRADLVVPEEEHEGLRSMAWNWAKAAANTLGHPGLRGVERKVFIELNGWRLHGTLDLVFVEGNEGRIKDYKTGLTIPKQEKFERQFQGPCYGLYLVEGRWDFNCRHCGEDEADHPCSWPVCEIYEPYPDAGEKVAEGLTGAHVHQLYPRYCYCRSCEKKAADCGKDSACENPEYVLDSRYVYYDSADLADFKVGLMAVLNRIEHGLETGEYPALAGDHCGLCPAPHECPIPVEFRKVESIDTLEDAMATLSRAERLAAEVTRLKGSARAYAEANEIESILLAPDSDQEYAFTIVKSGTRTSTKFAKRTRKER